MKRLGMVVAVAILAGACAKESASLEIKPGNTVSVEKKDGVVIVGRLVEVKPEHVTVDTSTGRREIARSDISTFRADASTVSTPAQAPGTALAAERSESSAGANAASASTAPLPEYREVTLPAGTVLPVELTTAVASDMSQVEDAVRGTLRRAVTVGGVHALPAGTAVTGVVTAAERSARVKGRARVAFRFTAIDPPGNAPRMSMRTDTVSRLAEATKKQDAFKIGGGAAGGAIVGGILGGGDGAAKGAAIGGAAGTGVVLATRGKEIRLAPGTPVSVRLAAPLTVRVRVAA